MSDAYVPEPDALEQAQDLESVPVADEADDGGSSASPALVYPERVPSEVNDADALEQAQPLPWEDEHD